MGAPSPLRAGVAIVAAVLAALAAGSLGEPVAAIGLTALMGGLTVWFALAWAAREPDRALPVTFSAPQRPDTGALFEAIDEPLILVERQSVTRANGAARAVLGEHILGQDIRLAIRHPAAAERLTGRIDRRRGEPIELVGLGERDRRWEMTVHALDRESRLVRLRDRSGAHATERMRVDFVANASHELRTPLATLIGFIETLEDGNAAEDAATRSRFLKIMSGEAKRMQQLVDDLMSLSRIEAEKHSLPQTAVALAPLIDEVAHALRATMREGADRIIIEAGDVGPVLGDRAQLSQLLHNLIGNALKYGRAGTAVTVSLSAGSRDMLHLSIADEGEGIPAEHLPRLTERFYRVDPGRSRVLGGTGLGLAIVKHIVERHRGRLDIDSVVGTGTTVTVLLPEAPISQGGEVLSSKSHEAVTEDSRNGPTAGQDAG